MTHAPLETSRQITRAIDLYFLKTGGVDEWERAKRQAIDEARTHALAVAAVPADAGPSLFGMMMVGAAVGLFAWAAITLVGD